LTVFKITLEYDGTRYAGWQEQNNARTVMGELRKAAVVVFRGEVELQGAGRTDAGVHALGQVAHLRAAQPVKGTPAALCRQLNELLPADIAVLAVEQVPRSFHARRHAVSRAYIYQISTRKQAFTKKYVWWIKDPLDVQKMERAAKLLVGRHDFACFRAQDPSKPGESTIVVVEAVSLEFEEDIIQFRIVASHFLWRMVRRIVGALVRVGTGAISEADFKTLIDGRGDTRLDVAAWTAPAAGLFLEEVRY
jgi:tRNA pseudouridine38-40 synthase